MASLGRLFVSHVVSCACFSSLMSSSFFEVLVSVDLVMLM